MNEEWLSKTKDRLDGQGYSRIEGIDYDAVFARGKDRSYQRLLGEAHNLLGFVDLDTLEGYRWFIALYGTALRFLGAWFAYSINILEGSMDKEGFQMSSLRVNHIFLRIIMSIRTRQVRLPRLYIQCCEEKSYSYLKGTLHLGYGILGYYRLTSEAFSDVIMDHGGTFYNEVDMNSMDLQMYALTTNPTIYDSLVKQFWQTATANTLADGTLELHATIDTIVYTITKASIRNKLQLADASGITMLPNDEIFEGMGNMGYPTDGSFTFWKSFFTPQWRFLVHHILHCISSKSGGWDQFGSNIATALICLSTGRVYNFSKLIFDGMVANLKSKTKFLMYPRFLQLILDIQTENKHPYLAVTLTKKIFGNMKRGFRGAPRPLLPAMLLVATTNPSAGFAEIVDFLRGSNLRYALTSNPTIYDSLVKQFWQTATANTLADGTLELHATIDTIVYTITEASIRNKLQLADASGITMLPNNEIFEGMGHMGYPTDGSFTFWKSFFTPQWRFLVHHILHCISSKSGGWDQFGSNIATALICLSTGRVYNFSKLIFDGMVANLKSKTKFLMYPRFLQLILEFQTENKHPYLAVTLTKKIFGNMKRGFRGVPRPFLPAKLLVATTNPGAGQEHPDVAQTQPSSSTIPVPSTSSPPVQSSPPITAPIPASTPTPIPETDPKPIEHTFEEPSPTHQHFSPL
ncbi:hypothetical protein Tco_0033930 [Tanacetum coccineum]